jgi:ABC-type branched-subunit amino acid transport system substrate-binding protein
MAPDVVIGCAFPLTGEDAEVGRRALQGALVAAEVFDEVGPGFPLALAVRDTGGTPEGAARAVTELAREEGAVAIVGPVTSLESPAAAAAAQSLRVPIITLTQREGILSPGDFVFRALLTPRDQAEAIALYAVDATARGRFAVIYPDDPFGRDLARAFSEAAASRGGKVVRASAYRGVADLAGAVDRALGRPPGAAPGPPPWDAVFVPDTVAMGRLVAAHLAAARAPGLRLLGVGLWNTPEVAQGRDLEGAIFAAPFAADAERATTRRFVERYRQTFGGDPEAFAAQSHDAVTLLVDLLRTEPGAGRERARWKIQNTVAFEGAAGRLSFEGQRDGRREAMILMLHDGRIVPAEAYPVWTPPAGSP